MIINSIEIWDWRKIDYIKLDLNENINIIFGENEAGKSTIIETIKFAFFEKAESDKQELKKIIPWGKDLKAKVRINFFSTNHYEIEKSFPKGESFLYLLKDNSKIKIAEGKAVNKNILSILNITEELIPLFELLWIEQGKNLDLFKDNNIFNNNLIQSEIKTIIKQNLITKLEEDFYNEVCEKYFQYFTEKRNDLRKEINDLIEEFKKKLIQLNEIEENIKQISLETSRLNEISNEIKNCEENFNIIKKKLEELGKIKENFFEFERIYENFILTKKEFENFLKITEEKKTIEENIEKLSIELKKLLRLSYEKKLKNFEEKKLIREKIIKKEEEIKSFRVKDDKVIQDIISLKKEIENCETQIKLNKLLVEIETFLDYPYVVKIDKQLEEINKKSKKEYISSEEIEINLKDIANIKIKAPIPKEKIKKLEENLQLCNNELNKIYTTLRCNNLAEIKIEFEKYKEALTEYNRLKFEISGYNFEEEEKKINDLKKEIESLKIPEELITEKPENINLKNDEIISKLKTELSIKNARLIEINKILKKYQEEDIKAKYLLLEEKMKKVENELQFKKEDLENLIKETKNKKDNLEIKLKDLYIEKSRLETKSEQADNLEKNKKIIEKEYLSLKEKVGTILIEAYTYKYLKELIEEERNKLDENLVLPIQNRITELFKKLTASNYEQINLTKNFKINHINIKNIRGELECINLDNISFGSKEQLSFLLRLAIAEYLSRKEKILMILDDTFVNTDNKRLSFLIDLMEKNKERIQFLIFTCKLHDYKNYLKDFNLIELKNK